MTSTEANRTLPRARKTGAPAKPLILVVDDSPEVLGLISQALGSHYDLIMLSGVRSAMLLLDETRVDLLVTDIRMPDGDGMTLADFAMARSRTPVVFLSGFVDEQTAVEATVRSPHLLIKPFRLGRLFAVIREALGERDLGISPTVLPPTDTPRSVTLPANASDAALQAGDELILEAADPVALHGGELLCYRSNGQIRVARFAGARGWAGEVHARLWRTAFDGRLLEHEDIAWKCLMGVVCEIRRHGYRVWIPPRRITWTQRFRHFVGV